MGNMQTLAHSTDRTPTTFPCLYQLLSARPCKLTLDWSGKRELKSPPVPSLHPSHSGELTTLQDDPSFSFPSDTGIRLLGPS